MKASCVTSDVSSYNTPSVRNSDKLLYLSVENPYYCRRFIAATSKCSLTRVLGELTRDDPGPDRSDSVRSPSQKFRTLKLFR
jgi:hypothetical protein